MKPFGKKRNRIPDPVPRCKVCDKRVVNGEEVFEVSHRGVEYVVCCPICAEKFREDPDAYAV